MIVVLKACPTLIEALKKLRAKTLQNLKQHLIKKPPRVLETTERFPTK